MKYRVVSLADQVYDQLEADILSGKYPIGEILTEAKICEDLNVSRTPVREALHGLLQEHLVEETSRGVRVLGISEKDFADMGAVRLRIGGLAIQGFIKNLNDATLNELREALELQEFYLSKKDTDQMKTMDSRFHLIIYEHCGSRILRDILAPLHKKIQKYRRLSLEKSGRARKSYEEHLAIFEAIRDKDTKLAEERMNEHVKNAMSMILPGKD